MMLNKTLSVTAASAIAFAGLLSVSSSTRAVDLDTSVLFNSTFQLDNDPLFFGVTPAPNIVILMDDSKSMSSNVLMPLLEAGVRDGFGTNDGETAGSRDDAMGRGRATDLDDFYYDALAPMDPAMASLRATLMDDHSVDEPGFGLVAPTWKFIQAWKALDPTDFVEGLAREAMCPTCDTSLEIDETGDPIWQLTSSTYNKIYYNPDKTYEPWAGVDSDDNAYVNADPSAAFHDPYSRSGDTVDLTAQLAYYPVVQFTDGVDGEVHGVNQTDISGNPTLVTLGIIDQFDFSVRPAHYYTEDIDGNPVYVSIEDNDELVNFANWFQYYRSRSHIAKGALASVIASLGGARVGFTTISNDQDNQNPVSQLNDDVTTGAMKNMLDMVFSVQPYVQGSSVRNALWHAGEYFSCDAATTRYDTYYETGTSATSTANRNMFGDSSCPMLDENSGGQCQANYAILITDGFDTSGDSEYVHSGYPGNDGFSIGDNVSTYNNPFETDTKNTDELDADSGFDGGAYADVYSDTLADVAMDYFERDINSTLAQDQRMKTHVISLGASTTVSTPTDPTVAHGWTNPIGPLFPSDPENETSFFRVHSQDDLVHAAFNGRGKFIEALDENLVSQLAATLAAASDFDIAGGNISSNAAVLNGQTYIYTTSYNTEDLSGDLFPLQINADGTLGESPWALSAAQQLEDDTDRVILTYKYGGSTGDLGMDFSHGNLQNVDLIGGIPIPGGVELPAISGLIDGILSGLLGTLNGVTLLEPIGVTTGLSEAQVDYIRGNRSGEVENGGAFRNRGDTVLGPIFHSEPVVVASPGFDYPDDPDAPETNYSAFRTEYANRTQMVYVAANDGMLHGFRASDGKELLAYVPGEILPKFSAFTNPSYVESPVALVDGRITIVDAFDTFPACGGSACWRTILVGALRAGGQSIYALDITDPADFSVANAGDIVLWEFNDQAPLLSQDTIKGLLEEQVCGQLAGACDAFLTGGTVSALISGLIQGVLDTFPSEVRGHAAMGYIYGQPNVSKLADADDSWAVIIGNGINSNEVDLGVPNVRENILEYSPLGMNFSGNAFTFIIDLADGTLKKEFTTGSNEPAELADLVALDLTTLLPNAVDLVDGLAAGANGILANGIVSPATIDANGDGDLDHIYVVDMHGSLNRIDVDSSDVSTWGFSNDDNDLGTPVAPLFSTTRTSNKLQPVSTEPMVIRHPTYDPNDDDEEGYLVLFGTGTYFESEADPTLYQNQSFYAIWDKDGVQQAGTLSQLGETEETTTRGNRNDLYQRYIDREIEYLIDTDGDGSGELVSIRTTSGSATFADVDAADSGVLDWSSKNGWFIDLVVANGPEALDDAENFGERLIVDPFLRNGKILFNTLLPGDNACTANDRSVAYQLDASDGTPTFLPAFDLNGDGYVSRADRAEIDDEFVDVSGRLSTSGQNSKPVVIIDQGQEVHININQDGGVEITKSNPVGYEHSRSTWREIR